MRDLTLALAKQTDSGLPTLLCAGRPTELVLVVLLCRLSIATYQLDDVLDFEGLGHIFVGTDQMRFETVYQTITSGDDNDRNMLALRVISQELDDLEAVHTWQDKIDKQKIRQRNFSCHEQRMKGQQWLQKTPHLVSLPTQSSFQDVANGWRIIDKGSKKIKRSKEIWYTPKTDDLEEKDGTDRGSEGPVDQDSRATQRKCASSVSGTHGESPGPRWGQPSRAGVGLESQDDS